MSAITLNPLIILAIGFVAPLLVAFLTKKSASGGIKGFLMASLVALATIVETIVQEEPIITQEVLVNGLATWLTAATAYTTLLKPFGATEAIAAKTAEKGVG